MIRINMIVSGELSIEEAVDKHYDDMAESVYKAAIRVSQRDDIDEFLDRMYRGEDTRPSDVRMPEDWWCYWR